MSAAENIPDELFRLMVEQNSIGIVLTDREGCILYVNPRQLQASGYTLEEVQGKNPRIFAAGETPAEVYAAMWAAIIAGQTWHGELTNRRKNGEICRELVRISPVRNPSGDITHFFAIKEENLWANAAHLLAGTQATVDPLTGLPNRAMLMEQITKAIRAMPASALGAVSSAEADAHPGFAVITIDIDKFRLLNETIGNLAADDVLMRIAVRLNEAVRQSDAVARTGGNEFCLLVLGRVDTEWLEDLGRRLLAAIATPIHTQGRTISISASLGIARCPLDSRDAEELLHCAYSAMGAAKLSGGDDLRFYEPGEASHASELIDLAAGLREVVQRDELRLHYQPKVDLHSGKIVGFEALVRWQHPTLGLIAPGRFITVAEETGLIVNLSQWVIRNALAQQRIWQAAGLPLLPVGVNLSLRHFHGLTLPHFLDAVFAETGLPPTCLELEIGESAMMRDPTQAFIIADRIRALGVRLALDEFGTGLSSLSYLSRLTVDALKIDQVFVRDITTNPVNASIVSAIIAMAHKLGKRCVAVGVETEGQALQLRRYDCDEIQGFYFSKPVPAEEVAVILSDGRNLALAEEVELPVTQSLLLVDDEPNILNALKRLLRREGYQILTAESGAQALELLARQPVQVIVSDHRMPGMTGVDFLSRVRDLYPQTRRIILSGYSDIGTLTDAINRGAVWKFISKPWEDDALKADIKHAFDHLNQ
jgi:diguanylate cyclase (GGDEF)-like protein/PAS domain S-box-containing protein